MIDIEGEYLGIPAVNIGKTKPTNATDAIIIGTQESDSQIGNLIDNRNNLIIGKNREININNSIIGGSKNTVYGLRETSSRHNTNTTNMIVHITTILLFLVIIILKEVVKMLF